MTTVPVDTHRLVSDLKQDFGFSEQQAEGISDAIQRINLDHLASKGDLRELELRLTLKLGSLIAGGVAFLAFLKFFG